MCLRRGEFAAGTFKKQPLCNATWLMREKSLHAACCLVHENLPKIARNESNDAAVGIIRRNLQFATQGDAEFSQSA